MVRYGFFEFLYQYKKKGELLNEIFRVQNLFLEDIHLILFLPKISCASTKLSTQLSETVEEPFSSDITRTHRYKSAILNNVARSSALGRTYVTFAVTWEQSEHVNRNCLYDTNDTTLPESSYLQSIHILSREGLLIKRYWLVFLMLIKVSLLPR